MLKRSTPGGGGLDEGQDTCCSHVAGPQQVINRTNVASMSSCSKYLDTAPTAFEHHIQAHPHMIAPNQGKLFHSDHKHFDHELIAWASTMDHVEPSVTAQVLWLFWPIRAVRFIVFNPTPTRNEKYN